MENGPFEDVFPIKHGDIRASYVSLPEGRNSHKNPKCNIQLTFLGAASAALQLLVSLTCQWLLSLARGARSTTRLSGLGVLGLGGSTSDWKAVVGLLGKRIAGKPGILEAGGVPWVYQKNLQNDKILPDSRFQQFPANQTSLNVENLVSNFTSSSLPL